jgi:hypothetical protein
MFAEKGFFSDIPTIKVLLSVFELELTGILYMKNEDVLKVLYFNRGKLVWAMSNASEDKLEDILIAKKLVDNETLVKVKAEEVVSVSVGKALVERGIITLEQLIESTKLQLRMIVRSVLKWDEGGFQFVKETPPERLFSLDMNVMTFLFNYVMREIDMTVVWREIRSVQTVLKKTASEDKIDRYGLTDKEKNFLLNFEQGTKLEAVLKKYGGSDRDSLLKIVYFFLVSDILSKDASAIPGASAPAAEPEADREAETIEADAEIERAIESNIEKSMEPEPGFETGMESEVGGDVEPEPEIEEEVEPELPLPPIPAELEIGMPESPDGIDIVELPDRPKEPGGEETHFFERDQDVAPTIETLPEEDELDVGTMVREDKKKNKQFNFLMFFVILILIVGGVIFLLLQPEDEAETGKSKPDQGDVVQVQERKPVVPAEKQKSEPIEVQMKKEAPLKKETTVPKREVKPLKRDDKGAFAYFEERNFIRAGELWEKEVRAQGVRYTVLLELDCLKESVINAYSQVSNKEAFYILNRRLDGRDCFLVLWGKFNSESEATAAMDRIPLYFRQQNPPARVVNLQQYL